MKRRKHKGVTPTFPALRDAMIPPGSPPMETPPPASPKSGFFAGMSPTEIGTPRDAVTPAQRRAAYNAFIHSGAWRDKCAPIIRRAAGHCEHCKRASDTLEVHHLTYERFGGRELQSDLLALCPPCHTIADAERREEMDAALDAWIHEAEERKQDRAFDTSMRKRYGDDWHNLDNETVAREAEKFRTWQEAQYQRDTYQ